MKNPWFSYDYKKNQTVHSSDLELFLNVNKRLQGKKKVGPKTLLSSTNVALPYFGNPNANVLLLYANPGLDTARTKEEEKPKLKEIFDKARKHQKIGAHQFVFLLEEFRGTPGYEWWSRTLAEVIDLPDFGPKILNNLFSVEIHPYKSVKYGALSCKEDRFPTSEYTYELVRKAMQRNSLILIARAHKDWFRVIEGLEGYKNKIYLSSAQQSKISSNNVILDRKAKDKELSKKKAWNLLLDALRN